GRDAGGDAFGGLDGDREVGVVRGGVVVHHRRQAQLLAALARQRQAHQAACVRDHEVDVGGPHQLGGHDQVALVLAVLVVDDDDHAAGAELFEQFGDGGEGHGEPAGGAARARRGGSGGGAEAFEVARDEVD